MTIKLTSRDVKLHVNEYIVEDSKGIVICVHGMCEHSKRYTEFALFLNRNGYSVYTYDHRGHGESLLENEQKGYLGKDGFNAMVEDLNTLITFIRKKYPDQLLFLLGHSMGSFVAQRYVQLYDTVDGLILSGSNYGFKMLRIGKLLSKILCILKGEKSEGRLLNTLSFGSYNKKFKPNRTSFDWLSRDEAIVDNYINDDMCGFICSNLFYHDFFAGLLEIGKSKNMKKINPELPILIISGDKDPVGNQGKGVKALYRVLRNHNSHVDLKLYQNSRHEVLNEVNKSEVFQDILNWWTMIE